ncbi:MAG: two-component sensor histidine kinase, partial [Lachnospiraceae bacterium]|nr:two-component sensor histidine kinase [Lachnospiraceae bacterium]
TILEVLLIIAIVGVAAFLAVILSRPFNKVTNAIIDVKEGRRSDALPVSYYVETTHMIDAFNQLLERERILDESRQEFVANVSHELKTPLASMKVLADSLLEMGDADPELYKEFLGDIAKEIDRENSIITDLLSLVKMDKTANEPNISNVKINDLLEIILKRLRPIARKMDVEVMLECHREVEAEVDEVKMSLIISNLVENAIKYNKEHGHVNVTLDADHQHFTLEVKDTGIGIPKDALGHIYERFYRVDKSHSREIGGTGLGLAITKNAISLHRGTIKVTSEENVGTTVLVSIPLIYVKKDQ